MPPSIRELPDELEQYRLDADMEDLLNRTMKLMQQACLKVARETVGPDGDTKTFLLTYYTLIMQLAAGCLTSSIDAVGVWINEARKGGENQV